MELHIERMCEKNKKRQESFIHLAIDYQELVLAGKCYCTRRKIGNVNYEREYYILEYLKKIKENMVKIGDEYTMYAPVLNKYGKWNYDVVDNNLYDGIGGMALVEHYFGKDEMIKKFIFAGMENLSPEDMKEFYLSQKDVGFNSVYSVFHIISFTKEQFVNQPQTIEIINWFYMILEELINNEIESDYINGSLCIVGSLLRLYEKNKRVENKKLAINYIEKAIENQNSLEGYGMAHGIMGMTLMLYKLWSITGIKKYLVLGERNLKKIKDNYDDIKSMSWCRGKIGIGIGLLAIYKTINSNEKNTLICQMIEKVHRDICNESFMTNDCLCHGNLGVVDYFIYRYQTFENGEDIKIAKNITDMVKNRMIFRSLPEVPCFGIFTGEGGFAYEILRLNKCGEIPSLLC